MSDLNLKINLWPKQTIAWGYLHDDVTEEIGFGGRAGGGKTTLGSQWEAEGILRYPGSRWFIGRKALKDIRQTTLINLVDIWRQAGITTHHYTCHQKDSR